MAVVYYLKESEEQKGVLEAKDDEEKECELELLYVRVKHGDDDETNKAQTWATVCAQRIIDWQRKQ